MHEIRESMSRISWYPLRVHVPRDALLGRIRDSLASFPVTVLTGPRRSGKTTLARALLSPDSINYFDLEDPASLEQLRQPMLALRDLEGLIVIDEVQRHPELFPVIRVLADREALRANFLILGSASGQLLRQSSESLAGRAKTIAVGGFDLTEVGGDATSTLWNRGGLPRSYLAANDDASLEWRKEFITTLLERDLPQWGVRVPAVALLRFWSMLAHRHAQLWNAADLARSMDQDPKTTRRYLDLLTDALVVRQLHPWHANLGKSQVKSPKVYVRDSGLLHQLLGIRTARELLSHQRSGASWEGFAIEQVRATEPHDDAWFWATHQGAELDLLLRRGDRWYGVECKRTDAPSMTRSMRIALEDLSLDRMAVLHPGSRRYPLSDKVEAVPLASLSEPGRLFGDS